MLLRHYRIILAISLYKRVETLFHFSFFAFIDGTFLTVILVAIGLFLLLFWFKRTKRNYSAVSA